MTRRIVRRKDEGGGRQILAGNIKDMSANWHNYALFSTPPIPHQHLLSYPLDLQHACLLQVYVIIFS